MERFLGGSADILQILTLCFVWKENAWIAFQAQGCGLWAGKEDRLNLGTKGGVNGCISSQGHRNLFQGMNKEQGLSLPSIAHKYP